MRRGERLVLRREVKDAVERIRAGLLGEAAYARRREELAETCHIRKGVEGEACHIGSHLGMMARPGEA